MHIIFSSISADNLVVKTRLKLTTGRNMILAEGSVATRLTERQREGGGGGGGGARTAEEDGRREE
ncbi:hypothetical protein E2C01_022562 [Portunus trituberculatus]|uniref:Uncharacterized protein n=1 Tax=Portunus trituberculatus TaxID=210409 RepID=A0A5B7E980_PORTR|nr:hypothetical protein [Portunus trituberculatus]